MNFAKTIEITEVCPRDGWQNHPVLIPVERKIELIKKMMDCGPKVVEVTSFVNPKYVPQMAGAAEVVAGVAGYAEEKGVTMLALALNKRGVDSAREAGVKYVSFVVSASEEHNKRNANRTIEESMTEFKKLAEEAKDLRVALAMPCVFGSPFGDEVPMDRVLAMCEAARSVGISEFGFADTAGISTPKNMRERLQYLKKHMDLSEIGIHLHDTQGMGLANAYVALEEGVYKFDASLGAMGGCPFVPGAKGNIGTEDLLNMTLKMGLECEYDLDKAVALSLEMSSAIDAPVISSVAALAAVKAGKNEK
ncbi:MAG: Hydroxymethylglutaryl-CoA lyase YngG [Desulfovibrio sp.]